MLMLICGPVTQTAFTHQKSVLVPHTARPETPDLSTKHYATAKTLSYLENLENLAFTNPNTEGVIAMQGIQTPRDANIQSASSSLFAILA